MRNIGAKIVTCMLWIFASSCTIHQPLPSQDIILHGAGDLPVTIGVVDDPAFVFDYPNKSYRLFVEDMNPGFTDTLQGALSYSFRSVSVVHPVRGVPTDDVIALSRLEMSDPMKLTITFVDPKSGRSIEEVSATRRLDWNADGAYSNIGTDLILFVIVVAAPPLDPFLARTITRHDAERFNAAFAPAIAQMVGEIALRASRDPALRAFTAARH